MPYSWLTHRLATLPRRTTETHACATRLTRGTTCPEITSRWLGGQRKKNSREIPTVPPSRKGCSTAKTASARTRKCRSPLRRTRSRYRCYAPRVHDQGGRRSATIRQTWRSPKTRSSTRLRQIHLGRQSEVGRFQGRSGREGHHRDRQNFDVTVARKRDALDCLGTIQVNA